MNIVIISNSAAPSKNASSLQTSKLCETLSYLNHRVTLILPNTGNGENYFNFYNIKNKFKIIRLKLFKKFPKGIKYYLFSLLAIYKSFYFPLIYLLLEITLQHLFCVYLKKTILEVHDTLEIEGRLIRFLQSRLNFLSYNNITKIVVTTQTLKKYFITKWNVKENKIQVLHNGTSLRPSGSKQIKTKKISIGYFGSIYKSRGIEMILKICRLDKKNDYIVYGGTKEQVKKIKSSNFNNNLFIKKHIPYKQVSKKLKDIDVCILPYTKKITVSGDIGDISNYTSPLKVLIIWLMEN